MCRSYKQSTIRKLATQRGTHSTKKHDDRIIIKNRWLWKKTHWTKSAKNKQHKWR